MIRRTLLILVALVTICLPVVAQNQTVSVKMDQLAKIEERLFSAKFDKEPIETRLQRLEETIYGQASSQMPPDARIDRLSQTLSGTEPPKVEPVAESHSPQNAPAQNAQPNYTSTANPDGEDLYPTITAMEQQSFNRHYRAEDLDKRLARLEAKWLKKQQGGDLRDRVDRLQPIVLGNRPVVPQYGQPAEGWYGDPVAGNSQNAPYQTAVGQPPMMPQQPQGPTTSDWDAADGMAQNNGAPTGGNFNTTMDQVERKLLRQNFPGDPVDVRLDRMEMRVFHMTAPDGVAPEERLERLAAVTAGGGEQTQSVAMRRAQQILPWVLMLVPLFI